jgi:hypothetical protein
MEASYSRVRSFFPLTTLPFKRFVTLVREMDILNSQRFSPISRYGLFSRIQSSQYGPGV